MCQPVITASNTALAVWLAQYCVKDFGRGSSMSKKWGRLNPFGIQADRFLRHFEQSIR